ncbi:MAG: sucrase ferredoxin [Chloroflexi bacterium]|nr:sucrase ferredoxin [Chloroflexota bacterium]
MIFSDQNIDNKTPLPGTVKFYQQHIIICIGHSDWPSNINHGDDFTSTLNQAIINDEHIPNTRLTACDSPSIRSGTDILLFPHNIRLLSISMLDIPNLILFLKNEIPNPFKFKEIEKMIFLVCGHQKRDDRCGKCGPMVLSSVQETISNKRMSDQVEVFKSSHLGGHRFAGILVCYPSGNWYGRVNPSNVEKY